MNIEKHVTDNVGGICRLFYFFISDLLSHIPVAPNKVHVQIRSVAQFYQIKFTDGTAFVTEELIRDKDGEYTKFQLTALLPGSTEELINELSPLLTSPVGIIYQLNSGEWKTAGSKQEKLKFTTQFNTGKELKDRKGIQLETTRQFIHPIPFAVDPTTY